MLATQLDSSGGAYQYDPQQGSTGAGGDLFGGWFFRRIPGPRRSHEPRAYRISRRKRASNGSRR
ncbi:MAG: hypothetical protein ABI085_14525 [Gemmatimonadaceae bacterium]